VSSLAHEYAEHLEIHEAASINVAGPIRADGLVPIHVIRPGIGRGKGRHVYEAKMLEEHAGIFRNWKMFVDHQAPEAKRAAGGLPRSIRDLGGIIKESWWDGTVPADEAKGHGQGAVVALCRPTPLVKQLIETDPALVEASISATATAVRPVTKGGQTAWLVEGLNPSGSVDWVSMAGAGGKVVQLAEALQESLTADDEAKEVMESMTDDEVIEHLRETRPDLYQQVIAEAKKAKPKDESEDEPSDEEELGDTETDDADEIARRKAAKAKTKLNESTTTEEEEVKIDIESLREALATDEGKQLVEGLVEPLVDARFQKVAAPKLAELVEAAMEEEREVITAEAEARADRKLHIRDMKDAAHGQINESRLPETFKAELRARYDLVEGEPTAALDVADEKDEAGKVVKKADDILKEAVAADIKTKSDQHAEIAPTRVRGQGPSAAATVEETGDEPDEPKKKDEKETITEAKTTGSGHFDHVLQEAGVQVDEHLYDGILP
jgi:hypothetical protein